MTTLKAGDKVRIILKDNADLWRTDWWPKRGIETTGTVQKLYKNGKVAVAVHQLRNNSEDRCHTLRFDPNSTGTVLEVIS